MTSADNDRQTIDRSWLECDSGFAMLSSWNARIRTLQRAAQALGGAQQLAAYLNVKLPQVEEWIAGRTQTPPEVFAAALDVVAAGPFAAWDGSDERHQAHADRLREIAKRIKTSAEQAQRIADQAQLSANRANALAHVQRVLAGAKEAEESESKSVSGTDQAA